MVAADGADERSRLVKERLEALGVACESTRHEPIFTVAEGEKIAERAGALCCKNLMLKGKRGIYLLIIPSKKRLDNKRLSKQIGSGHLSFASDDDLMRLLGVTRGAVGPLGLIFDEGLLVKVLVDREVTKSPFIDCHPCRNDESLKIAVPDLLGKFIPATGHEVTFVDL